MFELHEQMLGHSIARLQSLIDVTVEGKVRIFEIIIVVLNYAFEKMAIELGLKDSDGTKLIPSEEVIRIIVLSLRKLSDEINAVITN